MFRHWQWPLAQWSQKLLKARIAGAMTDNFFSPVYSFVSQHAIFKLVPIIVGILAILNFFYTLLCGLPQYNSVIYPVFLCLILLGLIAYACVQYRKAKYADAVICIHGAMHFLRDAFFMLESGDSRGAYAGALENSVKEFSKAYTIILGCNVRACIKQIFGDENRPENERVMMVSDFCRSDSKINPKPDFVTDNSDFKKLLFDENLSYFFSNNLLKEETYENSHWTDERGNPRKKEYIATIVWPIHKKRNDPTGGERHKLLGYLCIDTLRKSKFHEEFDTQLGLAYADALYMLFYRLKEIEEDKKGREG